MRRTFFALLDLADLTAKSPAAATPSPEPEASPEENNNGNQNGIGSALPNIQAPGLHYNIQVHLPATKDIEVYNAIFKSLKEHLY